MILNIIVIPLISLFSFWSDDLKQLRECYQQVGKEERFVNSMLTICSESSVVDEKLRNAYAAAAKICSAKYKFSPYAKYAAFNAGRTLLDKAVQADSLNPEIRYLRYTIQANAPAFLGYQKNLKRDYQLITDALPDLKKRDPHLFAIIQTYFLVYNTPNR